MKCLCFLGCFELRWNHPPYPPAGASAKADAKAPPDTAGRSQRFKAAQN